MSGCGIYTLNPPIIDEVVTETELAAEAGVAGGFATLGPDGVVPLSQLPPSSLGALTYKGTWNCTGGTYPTNPIAGYYYVASVGGTISGKVYLAGDWLAYNGTTWDKVDNSSGHGHVATAVSTTTTSFGGKLSSNDDTVQKALDTLDDHTHTFGGDATAVTTIVSAFGGILTSSETTVQKALDKIDDHTHVAPASTAISTTTTSFNNILTTSDTTVQSALDTLDNSLVYNSSLGCVVFTYNT